MKEEKFSRCPNCGGTNLQTEPAYDEEEGPTGGLALFCVSCGYFFGEIPSTLRDQMYNFRSQLSYLTGSDEVGMRELLLGRKAASIEFD